MFIFNIIFVLKNYNLCIILGDMMVKPIIDKDDISISNLLDYVFLHFKRVLKVSLLILFIFIIYFFRKNSKICFQGIFLHKL